MSRLKGFRPADTVAISMVGKLGIENPTILPAASKEYDWRWVKDLDVALFISPSIEWRQLAFELKAAGPRYLCLWDVASMRGAEVLWKPIEEGTKPGPLMVVHCGWLWGMDYSSFAQEDNEAFYQ